VNATSSDSTSRTSTTADPDVVGDYVGNMDIGILGGVSGRSGLDGSIADVAIFVSPI
jgi:hypothetical protein